MTASVICFASAKGGSGKTVLSATFAAFIANLGKRVLLVDTDAATNGLSLFYSNEVVSEVKRIKSNDSLKTAPLGIFEVDRSGEPHLFPIGGSVDFIPAAYELKPVGNTPPDAFEIGLSRTLDVNRPVYDYIILDAQAGDDEFARTAMRQSDKVVIVAEFDPVSAAGVDRLQKLLRDVLTFDKTWILMNKILPEFASSFRDFLGIANYLHPIPWDSAVVRAYARRGLALDLERVNTLALAIMRATRSLLGDEIGAAIDDWLAAKQEVLREPVKTRLEETAREIDVMERERIDTEYRMRSLKLRARVFNMLFGLSLMILMVAGSAVVFVVTESVPGTIGTLVGLLFVGAIAVALQYYQLGKRLAKQEVELLGKAQAVTNELARAKEELSKLQTLAKSDMETLMGSGGGNQ